MEKETKKKEKCLCTCESVVDTKEFVKMTKYFPAYYWTIVINSTFINLIFSALVALFTRSLIFTIFFFLIIEIIKIIQCKVQFEKYMEKIIKERQKQGENDINIHSEFYDDYFIRAGETVTRKIKYTDINKAIETGDNFYLEDKFNKFIVIIQKEACDQKVIDLIKEKFPNIQYINELKKNKKAKKDINPKIVKSGMLILFIITIASLWGALYSVGLVNMINPPHGFIFTKNLWIIWCWLPIPILSIILGFKYNKVGFKCTKNIVAGFIIAFLLAIYGAFCLFPSYEQDYNKIEPYREIVDASLPKNGELEIQYWDHYFDDDKREYNIVNAYYDNEDVTELEKSIENSDNWILSLELKSNLKIFIPSTFKCDKNTYYSIYNKTLNEYNTLPTDSGDYEFYAIKYDKSTKHLEIDSYKYTYVK